MHYLNKCFHLYFLKTTLTQTTSSQIYNLHTNAYIRSFIHSFMLCLLQSGYIDSYGNVSPQVTNTKPHSASLLFLIRVCMHAPYTHANMHRGTPALLTGSLRRTAAARPISR